tara:strand:+ start:112 stop:288 length:177 start_codon:yes stop_codon:yes gene_type:complete
MTDQGPKNPVETAYEKAYQQAIREGAKTSDDLEIAIAEKMAEMGFVKPDANIPINRPD